MAVTLKEIARELGVSHQLVSYALNGTGTASEDTRRRIRRKAEEMGYRFNGNARAIRSGRFGCFAMLLSDQPDRSYLPPNLIRGVCEELALHDLHLTISQMPDAKLVSEGFVPKILRELMADGLLINYHSDIPQKLIDLMHRHRIPSVWLNVQRENDCVYPDDRDAALKVTRHLLRMGHKRITYFVNRTPHYSDAERYAGYAEATREAGREPRRVVEPEPDLPGWMDRWADRLLGAGRPTAERPTAVVAYDFPHLLLVFQAVCRLGLRVPRDVSLATFRDQSEDVPGLPLCGAVLPEREMGRVAVRLLQSKLQSEPPEPLAPVAVPCAFEPGHSAAPPP